MVKRSPLLFALRYKLSRGYKTILLGESTQLMIEGFPRSGNTYTVWAFRLSNPQLKIANHMHSVAHVLLALKRGIPVVVLIREPAAAAKSLLIRFPGYSPEYALQDYLDFYRVVERFSSELLLVSFETAVGDAGAVIAAVNQRFDMTLQVPESEQFESEIVSRIDSENRRAHRGVVNALEVPRPNAEKDKLKEKISLDGHQRLLSDARGLYARLASKAL